MPEASSTSDAPTGDPAADSLVVVSPPEDSSGTLATRIARRTTDLIAIALILIAGLTVAQRLLVWWRTDPAETLADPEIVFSRDALAPWGVSPAGVAIDLADMPLTLHRRVIQGSLEDALADLRTECKLSLTSNNALLPPYSDREAQLIAALRKYPPRETAPDGGWSLHEIPSPLAMTIGIRRGDAPGAPDRVVCWGLLLPVEEGTWSVLEVTPRPGSSPSQPADSIPLPADALPGLAVRDEIGGQLVTFTGAGPATAWRQHFDQLARTRHWVSETDWRVDSQSVSAVWIVPGDYGIQRLDLRLTHTDTGWTGLINISPTRQKDQP